MQLVQALTSPLSSSPLLAIRQRKGLQRSESPFTLPAASRGGSGAAGCPWKCHGDGGVFLGWRFASPALVRGSPTHPKVLVQDAMVGWGAPGQPPASPRKVLRPQHPCPALHGWEMSPCQRGTWPWDMGGTLGMAGAAGRGRIEPCHEHVGSQRCFHPPRQARS